MSIMNNIIIEAVSMAPIPGGLYDLILSNEQVMQLKATLHALGETDVYTDIKEIYFLKVKGFCGTTEECEALWNADHD